MKRATYYFFAGMVLLVLGGLDAITTIGGIKAGASEMNPLMAPLISDSLLLFAVVKIAAHSLVAAILLGSSYFLKGRGSKKAAKLLNIAFIGLTIFMAVIVVNNTLILFSFY